MKLPQTSEVWSKKEMVGEGGEGGTKGSHTSRNLACEAPRVGRDSEGSLNTTLHTNTNTNTNSTAKSGTENTCISTEVHDHNIHEGERHSKGETAGSVCERKSTYTRVCTCATASETMKKKCDLTNMRHLSVVNSGRSGSVWSIHSLIYKKFTKAPPSVQPLLLQMKDVCWGMSANTRGVIAGWLSAMSVAGGASRRVWRHAPRRLRG